MSLVTKISTYLRTVGQPTSLGFIVPENGGIVIDVPNFISYEQGNPRTTFDISETGYYGSGYMSIGSVSDSDNTSYPSFSYPIYFEKTGINDIYFRIMSLSNTVLEVKIFLDDVLIKQENLAILSLETWNWIQTSIIIPDNQKHTLKIQILSSDIKFNSIFITSDENGENSSADSPYITVHAKIFELDSDYQPIVTYDFYDAKNTLLEIKNDDWYNFAIENVPSDFGQDINTRYAFAIFVSGASDKQYIIWDYASDFNALEEPYGVICSINYDIDNAVWRADCERRYALRAYTFRDSLDAAACEIITPAASLSTTTVKSFGETGTSPFFFNTKISTISDSENKVVLSLPDKVISLVVDNSGSMSWNDPDNLRLDITRRFVNKIESTYPGDVKWNLVSVQGTPIRLNFFGVVESDSVNTNDISEAATSYFSDQESGFSGVRVVRKLNSYPLNPLDGDIVTEGFFDRSYDDNLTEGNEYFYKVYSFDSNGTFSNGVEIRSIPRVRNIPTGINKFSANILKGTGVIIDDDVIGSWHLSEGEGLKSYDFSSSENHMTYSSSSEPIWLNANDVPSGSSGIRFNGYENFSSNPSESVLSPLDDITFMAWINVSQEASFIPVFSIDDILSGGDFEFSININNGILNLFGPAPFSSSLTVSVGQWHHIAFTYNSSSQEVNFFVDGIKDGPYNYYLPHGSAKKIIIGGSDYIGNYFRGKITEVSLHKTIRSDDYISEQSTLPERPSDKILDNGDRLILLNYSIPEDFNYNRVRIVRKISEGTADYSYTGDVDEDGNLIREFNGFGLAPYHEEDGEIIYEDSASPGDFTISLFDNYIHNKVYNYKMFTQNSIDNFSVWSDSPVLSINIPPFNNNVFTNASLRSRLIDEPDLPSINSVTVTPGNRKTYIEWSSVNNSRVKQIQVFYKRFSYPIFSAEEIESGVDMVFNGNGSSTSFVHRSVPNDEIAYYAIVTVDEYGYRSEPYYFQSIPSEAADETGIPLVEIKKLRYELVNEETISLAWEQPVRFQKSISAWFDQRIALFAQITDEFGSPLADDSNIVFKAKATIESAQLAEDVFGEIIDRNITQPNPEETFILSSTSLGGGIVKGTVRVTSDLNILSSINNLNLTVSVFFSIPNKDIPGENSFEFNSLPINIKMSNPFKMELVNQSNDIVKHLCKQEVPLNELEFIATGGLLFDPNIEQEFDGAFIRRQRPFVARIKTTYRDKPLLVDARAFVAVYEASDPGCDDPDNPNKKFTPFFSDRKSKSVQPLSTTLDLLTTTQVELDNNNNEITKEISYADISLQPPNTPQGVMLFAQVSYNGFVARKKMYIVFENILRLELTVNEPEPDCIDVAEQFASVYLIDPNSPRSFDPDRILISSNEICKWNLRKGISGKDRPFYSLDNTASGPGVFSLVRNSVARKVFFGPACAVTWQMIDLGPERGGPALLPEMYAVKASIVYDGLRAFEERPLIVYPPSTPGSFGSRFLMNFNDVMNEVWADGYDYEKLTIHRDPNIASGTFASAFRECSDQFGGTLFALNYGQIVNIESGNDFDILYGENLSIEIDPYIDESVFSNYDSSVGFATINLSTSSNQTDVYFKINKFLGRQDPPPFDENESITNRCESIQISRGLRELPDDAIIYGRTSLNVDGQVRYLSAGGSLQNGIPPTVLRLKEPLSISISDIRRDNESVESVLVDGETSHEVLLEVSFAGKPVPNGTPVVLSIGGKNPSKIALSNTVVYTSQVEDEALGVGVKSIARFTILPLNPIQSFSSQVKATCRYDKKGTVEREMNACLTIQYDANQRNTSIQPETDGVINNVFDASLFRYDTVSQLWETKTEMAHPRGGCTLNYDGSNSLFCIGGINGNSITKYVEKYDISSDSWVDVSPMNSSRFYHSSAYVNNYIYVFGGITIMNNELIISNSVERYDIINDLWENMSSMPSVDETIYGIAMGCAHVVGDLVYISCGIKDIDSEGKIVGFNDRTLVYNTSDDSWSYSDIYEGQNLEIYQRISPYGFVKDSTIYISGGALINNEDESQLLEFATDTFSLDTLHLSITANDSNYEDIPKPRYKGGCTSISENRYFLGGSNGKSNNLKIFESIDSTSVQFPLTQLSSIEVGRQSFGIDSDNSQYIYVSGGITSGRPAGFLQIKATTSSSTIRLDGKQSCGINIELVDDSGERPSDDISIILRGFVVFKNSSTSEGSSGSDDGQQNAESSADRQSLVYPVVFENNEITISNGFGGTILLPRSDDLLTKINDIKQKLGITDNLIGEGSDDNKLIINEGEIRQPYSIRIQVTVVDDFYYGQTIVDISDNEIPDASVNPQANDLETNPAEPSDNTSNQNNEPSGEIFSDCVSYNASRTLPSNTPSSQSPGEGDDITEGVRSSPAIFEINPKQTQQFESPVISYYNDIEWLPQVVPYLSSNDGTASDVLDIISRFENSVPFGGSPFYDGLSKVADILLQDSAEDLSKSIYCHTDNEENLSITSLESAVENIQSIDGFGKTPVIVNNFSVVFPITLSALVARTDTNSLERISEETGGQSQTILSSDYIDEVVDNITGRVAGSIGWGMYESIVDIGVIGAIHNISLGFELFSNTDANWVFAISDDGINFGDYSEQYDASSSVDFSKIKGRYLKFKVTLLSGLSASIHEEYDLIPNPGSPALLSISIEFSIPQDTYIFLNKDTIDYSPQQIAVSVKHNNTENGSIEIGAATNNSIDWEDYYSGSQPSVQKNGKIFIPIRTNNDDSNEPLISVDGFIWSAKYGKWNTESSVTIRDDNNSIVDSSEYRIFARKGLVVFNSRRIGSYFIDIENKGELRIGMKITNNIGDEPIRISGLGYMYNTNVFLPPPLSERPPEATELVLLPNNPTIYSKIISSYKFNDLNRDIEDKSLTEIRWYINGVEREYLRDLTEWNDISNVDDPIWTYGFSFKPEEIATGSSIELFARQRGESILRVGDIVYFTVKPSDGKLYGSTMRSPSITCVAAPPSVVNLSIKGKKSNGAIQDTITSSMTAFADYNYFEDEPGNSSIIVWYVNGSEFKQGLLNGVTNGFENNALIPGELKTGTGIVALSLGNDIEVEIRPSSSNTVGNSVRSIIKTIQNDIPVISNAVVTPLNPTSNSNLQLNYTFSDSDLSLGDDAQTDQSSIKWYRKRENSQTFDEVTTLANLKTVTNNLLSSGDEWYAEIVPFDGISLGDKVISNTVVMP